MLNVSARTNTTVVIDNGHASISDHVQCVISNNSGSVQAIDEHIGQGASTDPVQSIGYINSGSVETDLIEKGPIQTGPIENSSAAQTDSVEKGPVPTGLFENSSPAQ
ncbi:hypothetical protein NE237_019844 [Protea cynaroides]|uniref:Uncharacterized protein n=1 Tax=Protea cynaroides TaxID=273540 RepID=A0A9Q0HA16_9MAGN|nr:hypothetical protein NE237_019844 [Protea cynaroides]